MNGVRYARVFDSVVHCTHCGSPRFRGELIAVRVPFKEGEAFCGIVCFSESEKENETKAKAVAP